MQNGILREFRDNPNVLAVFYNEGGRLGETRDWLETVWDNYYLGGSVIFDADGQNSQDNYSQPNTGLPFGKSYIIDQEGNVVSPYFGYNPTGAIHTIYELLENTSIDYPAGEIPDKINFYRNYPNPFNAQTTIQYSLPVVSNVTIDIYDILGRKVETLIDKKRQAGYHQAVWNARDISSGMYFYKIQAGEFSQTKKMVLLK